MTLASLVAQGGGVLAANPSQLLPAREQMAFTLGFHIILVPFGVAFTFLMLIANYRGIRRGDDVAMLLARRWSQVAGVLFAVGAVSGTVLSFELGLLWPGLMGRYGAAYGIPFAVEGLFFFLEAIFVAIYLYGWKRMRPWPHFWSGVPIVLAGIGGTASVVAANGRVKHPGGFTRLPGGGDRLGRGRQRLDEPAGWLHRVPGAGDRRPAVGGLLQRCLLARVGAHAAGRLHGGRVHRRRGVRGRHAARPAGPLPPAGPGDPVHRRGRVHAPADPGGRPRGAGGLPGAAGQVRRAGGRPDDGHARPAAPRWVDDRRRAALRHRDSLGGLHPGRREPRHPHPRPRRDPRRRPPGRPHRL